MRTLAGKEDEQTLARAQGVLLYKQPQEIRDRG
jgi:hypothetical protein